MNSWLRSDLDSIRMAALRAADPALAIQRHLQLQMEGTDPRLRVGDATWSLSERVRLLLIAVGKAAIPMAQQSAEILGGRLQTGLVVFPHGYPGAHEPARALSLMEAGHPIPDASSVAAGRAVEEMLKSADADCRLLVLLSGGASALLAAPPPGIALEELQHATALMLQSGADIQEVNTFRKHTDRLKGGQMARLAASTPMASLILSDVIGDRLDTIASGPTAPDPTTFSDCWALFERRNLLGRIPTSIKDYITQGMHGSVPETPKPSDPVFAHVANTIVGSIRIAADGAQAEAVRLGYRTILLTTFAQGEARDLGTLAADIAKELRLHDSPIPRPACIILGGETTVIVTGTGKGGRNQELALSAALQLEGLSDVAVMAFATDGVDGPTEAAGAIVDGQTVPNGRAAGLDAKRCLANNDAHSFLRAAGALIVSGPTNTNVNDLLVILAR